MTNIMIVDDELPIREWLQYVLIKTGLPLHICALCSNGASALDAFLKYRPTLIFTDIKMPEKDGISLLQEIRRLDPTVYIVMLTSHDSFEYARKSLKYNANEYILKNEISADVLRRVYHAYELWQEQGGLSTRKAPAMPAPLQSLLESWKQTGADMRTLCAQLSGYASEQDFQTFFVAAAPLTEHTQKRCRSEEFEQLSQAGSVKNTVFYYNRECLAMLISFRTALSAARQYAARRALARQIQSILHCSIGVSVTYSGISNFPKAADCAASMLAYQFYLSEGSAIFFQEDYVRNGEKTFSRQINAILHCISSQKITDASADIRDLLDHTEQLHEIDPSVLKNEFIRIFTAFQLVALRRNMPSTSEACTDAQKAVGTCAGIQPLRAVVLDLLDCIELNLGGREYSSHVQQAIAQIHEEYASIRRISDVSDRLNLNQEYFCRVFKQETGTTFNSYLTNYRLSIAKRLLSTTDQKISDIAQSVGYPNLSYFSRVFKDTIGITPFHYRDSDANN